MDDLIGNGCKDHDVRPIVERVDEVLSSWKSQQSYPGTSWAGIEHIHLKLTRIIDDPVFIETAGWYKYPTSTRPDQDGKDWRIVILTEAVGDVVINFHSLLHDNLWTINTTIYQTEEIDSSKFKTPSGLSHGDPWIQSMLWTLRLAKILETDGYNYQPIIDNMVARLQLVNTYWQIARRIKQDVIIGGKQVGIHNEIPPLSIAINDWSLQKDSVGMYKRPDDYKHGIITVNAKIGENFDYANEIIKHEMIHALLNEDCKHGTHGPMFNNVAIEVKLPEDYRD